MSGWQLSPTRGWLWAPEPPLGWLPGQEPEAWVRYAYVGQGAQPSGGPLPPSDPSHGDPRFADVYQAAVHANADEYHTNSVAALALSSHSNYAGALAAIDASSALWQKVQTLAQSKAALASTPVGPLSPPDPAVLDYATKFSAQAEYHKGQLQTVKASVVGAQASSPPPLGSAPPLEPLPAGMMVGWLAAIAAATFIFFRVAIMKRPL